MPEYMFDSSVYLDEAGQRQIIHKAKELAGGIYPGTVHSGRSGNWVRVAVKLHSDEFVNYLRGLAVGGVLREASHIDPI
jgi:hypothetical protein